MRKTLLLLFIVMVVACKKDDTPPDVQFKDGAGYTVANLSVAPGGTFTVGIIANRGADDLKLFYTEVAFDGANVGQLVSRVYLGSGDADHYTKDVTVTTRMQTGTERWIFNVNDAGGRISKKEIRVTVQ